MSELKATPGEWVYKDGLVVCYPSGSEIADTFLDVSNDSDTITPKQCRANGNLLAASKDMYEALECLMGYYEKCADAGHRDHEDKEHICVSCRDIMQAKRALAKARGETNE